MQQIRIMRTTESYQKNSKIKWFIIGAVVIIWLAIAVFRLTRLDVDESDGYFLEAGDDILTLYSEDDYDDQTGLVTEISYCGYNVALDKVSQGMEGTILTGYLKIEAYDEKDNLLWKFEFEPGTKVSEEFEAEDIGYLIKVVTTYSPLTTTNAEGIRTYGTRCTYNYHYVFGPKKTEEEFENIELSGYTAVDKKLWEFFL